MAITLANFAYALRTYYLPEVVMDTASKDHPFLNMLLKSRKKKVAGNFIDFPIVFSNGGGRSASFSDAQGNAGVGTKGVQLALTTVEDFAVVQIGGDVLEAAPDNGEGSFFEARVQEMDAKFRELGNSLGIALYRSGSGSIGRISSTQSSSSTTLTLVNRKDAKNLMPGMKVVGDSADGGGTVGTTVSFIKSVDLVAGTFTVAATDGGAAITAATADLAANQYIFALGDYDAKVKGVAAWIPATVSSSDSFFGVNRSSDRVRLAGWYLDKSGVPADEALYDALVDITDSGSGNPKHIFINANDWSILAKSQSSRVVVVQPAAGGKASYGFQSLNFMGPKGMCEVILDPDCPDKEAVVVELESWQLLFKGEEPIRLIKADGLEVSRIYNADGVEVRMKFNGQIGCSAPGHNARVILRA